MDISRTKKECLTSMHAYMHFTYGLVPDDILIVNIACLRNGFESKKPFACLTHINNVCLLRSLGPWLDFKVLINKTSNCLVWIVGGMDGIEGNEIVYH